MSPPTNKLKGGIRKSLLTPARRIGLSRKVPTPDNIANLLSPSTDIKQTTPQITPKVSEKVTTNKTSLGKAPIRIGLSKKVRTPSNVNKVLDILSPNTEPSQPKVHTTNTEPSKPKVHTTNNDISSRNKSPKQEALISSISKDATPTMHLLKPVKRLGLSRKVRTPDNISKLINSPLLTSAQQSPVTSKLYEKQSTTKDKSFKSTLVENKRLNKAKVSKHKDKSLTETSNNSSGLLEQTSLTPQIQNLKVYGSEISGTPKSSDTPNKSLASTESSTPLTHKTKSSGDIRVRPQSSSQQETPVTHIEAKRSRKSFNVSQGEKSDHSQDSDDDFVVKRCRKKLRIFDSDGSEKSGDLGEIKKEKKVSIQMLERKQSVGKKAKISIQQKFDCNSKIEDSDSDDEPLATSVIKKETKPKSTVPHSEVIHRLNEKPIVIEDEDDFASSFNDERPTPSVIKRRTIKSTTKEKSARLKHQATKKVKQPADDFDSSSDDEPLAASVIKRKMHDKSSREAKQSEVVKKQKEKTETVQTVNSEIEDKLKKASAIEANDVENISSTSSNDFANDKPDKMKKSTCRKSGEFGVKLKENSASSIKETVTKQSELSNKENIGCAISPDAPLASSMYRISSKTEGRTNFLQRQPSSKFLSRLSLKKSMSSTSFVDTDDELTIKPKKLRESNENNDEFLKECYVNIKGLSNLRVNSFSDTNSELKETSAINEIIAIEDDETPISELFSNQTQSGTPNSKSSSQESSFKKEEVSVELDDLEAEQQQALELHFRIIEKEERLEDLRRAESSKKKHNVQELQELTALWKTGCQNALDELLKKLQENGPFTMESLLAKLNTTSDFIGYDSDKGVFI